MESGFSVELTKISYIGLLIYSSNKFRFINFYIFIVTMLFITNPYLLGCCIVSVILYLTVALLDPVILVL